MKTELIEMHGQFSVSSEGSHWQVKAVDEKGVGHVAIFIGPCAKAYAEGHEAYLKSVVEAEPAEK